MEEKRPHTDEERLNYLISNGCFPQDIAVIFPKIVGLALEEDKKKIVTLLLDCALAEGFCPGYWRLPEESKDQKEVEKTNANGMVFVRNGDRCKVNELIDRATGK